MQESELSKEEDDELIEEELIPIEEKEILTRNKEIDLLSFSLHKSSKLDK